jgi:pimeloyl-ACP methyl ester carboxylesterase
MTCALNTTYTDLRFALRFSPSNPALQQTNGRRNSKMKATLDWLASNGKTYCSDPGQVGYAHLRNYSVEYRSWGNGPPLVLIPGLAGGLGLVTPLARHLAQSFQVISYQLRGEDDCFALRQRFGLKDLVRDLREFLEWQCLERPIIMGVSFGGALALEFAARHPERLEALVVHSAGARFERGLLQQVAGIILSQYPLPSDNPFVNQFFNLLFGKRQKPGPLFQFVTQQCWQTDQSVMAHRFRLVEQYDIADRLHRVSAPTLILSGERDLLVSKQSLQALRQGIPQSRFRLLSKAGHLAFVTQPHEVADEVRRFVTCLATENEMIVN